MVTVVVTVSYTAVIAITIAVAVLGKDETARETAEEN